MEPQEAARDGGADAALASRLRRIHRTAWLIAGVWLALAAVGTVWISERLLTAYVADTAANAVEGGRAEQ
jgi:hypothetical protein